VEFRLFGPVELWIDSVRLDLGPPRQKCALAVLLLQPGGVVPTTVLVDCMWSHEPPDAALSTLYGYLSHLRRLLGSTGIELVKRDRGYVIDVESDLIDIHRFRRLQAEACRTEDVHARAVTLDAALRLWRGTALSGITGRWADGVRRSLCQDHLDAVIARNDAYLATGRHKELITSLTEVVAEHPLDERPVDQLIRALYRVGRTSEALEQYQLLRDRLIGHNSTEPTPALRDLHQRVLRSDRSLLENDPPAPATSPVPQGLYPDIDGFTGRASELVALDALIPASNRRTVIISAIDGTPGVGKTTLALHWAHKAKHRFPDGNLYADLHGYGPMAPAQSQDILDSFLTVLGVAPGAIPPHLDAKADLYRSLLHERQVLIVLDNAATEQQVRPLLPGAPGCMVVVTSRSPLAGLIARDRAHRLWLNVPSLDEAVAILTYFLGAQRVNPDEHLVRELASLCSQLPLALCVAGERAARPGANLADLVDQLADIAARLDTLQTGTDPLTSVRAVFTWSYQALPVDVASTFRLLGLHPGTDIDIYAAAALTDANLHDTQRRLDALRRAHLIEQHRPGRYSTHDLLRLYASEQAAHEDAAHERRSAVTRLLDHYLATAATAMDTLAPFERHRHRHALATSPAPAVTEPAAATAWLDSERTNLAAVTAHAAEHGWPTHASHLPINVNRYLYNGGHYRQILMMHRHAYHAAQQINDHLSEAWALHNLGRAHFCLGEYTTAIGYHEKALALRQEIDDRDGLAASLNNLGINYRMQGKLDVALAYYRQALPYRRETADRDGEAVSLLNIGGVHFTFGRYAQALAHYDLALPIFREVSDPAAEGRTWDGIGAIHGRQGRYDEAFECHQRSLALFRQIGDKTGEGESLASLGYLHLGPDDELHGRNSVPD